MYEPDHAHTGRVKLIQQIEILAQRIGVFDTLIDNALASRGDT